MIEPARDHLRVKAHPRARFGSSRLASESRREIRVGGALRYRGAGLAVAFGAGAGGKDQDADEQETAHGRTPSCGECIWRPVAARPATGTSRRRFRSTPNLSPR